ncbi:MAG: hypothetical protein Q8J64_07925 [Thermodesulfovibrionales bacterium]|nr:hypothetical protein [Thermodesulfovibrionales bacterium]
MRRETLCAKRYCEATGKLHVPCPHRVKSGVYVHVVIKGGYCYRSKDCLVFECKFNGMQSDLDSVVSVVW